MNEKSFVKKIGIKMLHSVCREDGKKGEAYHKVSGEREERKIGDRTGQFSEILGDSG